MCTCVNVYSINICTCIYIYIYICMCVCVYVYVYHFSVYIYIYTCITYTFACVCLYINWMCIRNALYDDIQCQIMLYYVYIILCCIKIQDMMLHHTTSHQCSITPCYFISWHILLYGSMQSLVDFIVSYCSLYPCVVLSYIYILCMHTYTPVFSY